MPTVEIDETELLQNRQLRSMVETLGKNPRTARKFAELVKEVNPDAKINVPPPDPVESQVAELAKELAAERKAREEDKAERERNEKINSIARRRDEGFAKLRTERWTDDGLKKVEELMEKEGILDPLVAAAYIEKQNPLPEPVTPNHTGSWNFLEMPQETDAALKSLLETKGDNDVLADKMARDALNEFRASQNQRR